MQISPTSALLNEGGGEVDVEISLNFIDREGDVNHMSVNVIDSSGTVLYVRGATPSLTDSHSGIARALVKVNTDTLGLFTLRVWLVDRSVRTSNRLDAQFSVITGNVVSMHSMPLKRVDFSVASWGDRTYVLGGRDPHNAMLHGEPTADVQRYDPSHDSWTVHDPLPMPVANAIALASNGSIYLIGGETSYGITSDALQIFDIQSGAWTVRSPLPSGRDSAATAALNGQIYVLGGKGPGIFHDSVLRYDPALDLWSAVTPMHYARVNPCAVVVDGQILVFGGLGETQDEGSAGPGPLEIYDAVVDMWRLVETQDLTHEARNALSSGCTR